MKTYAGVEVQLQTFIGSSLDGGDKLHALVALPPGKEQPIHAMDRRVAGPQACGEEKKSLPCRCWESNHDN
jgi:hypothetical protein